MIGWGQVAYGVVLDGVAAAAAVVATAGAALLPGFGALRNGSGRRGAGAALTSGVAVLLVDIYLY